MYDLRSPRHFNTEPLTRLFPFIEVRAVNAVALGESHLRFGALNCGPEQLRNFIFVEYARRNP